MTVHIKELTIQTIIGILDFEREQEQNLIIDLEIDYDYVKNSFLNYADIVQEVTSHIKTKKYGLLEDAILELKDFLISKYPQIKTLYIKLTKPDIFENCHISLSKTWNF
ncbi:Dihydroneopterin aldolase [Sulfurovum sp. enrichment culture clone C5]|uniref:dihydroneopterin aldolase n=1 Tax=Sulfurovum sp. enrichment culture clone C5 TaxID=497650 RepID=A0A0S4XQ77_9BACT|nr:Dihydroneopterin aldolase [Sulfurovum sp. enrichment culture clone C5]